MTLPAVAHAQRDRPVYISFGGGPHIMFDCCSVHARASAAFGSHFDGNDTGFFLAAEAHGTFGGDYMMGFGGLRLGGDIELNGHQLTGILLRPSALFGAGFRDVSTEGFEAKGFVVAQPALELRFVFSVLVFWLRPAAFDIFFFWDHDAPGDWDVLTAYAPTLGFDFQL